MGQSPLWDTGSPSASQEILRLLWNPKDHILNHMNLVHIFASYFFTIHFNITFPSMPRFPKWSVLFRFLCISLFNKSLIWFLLVTNTNYEAPHDVIFAILLLLPPS